MLGADVSSEVNITGQEVREAERKRRMDAATRGFATANELVPEDRGTLRQSMFQPEQRGDSVVYGTSGVPYAEPMEFGTVPFQPPVQPLIEWAERVAGDPGLGYYVALEKIPTEGIDAQPYLRPSLEEARNWLATHGLDL